MAVSPRQVKNRRDQNGKLTGRPGKVYDVNIKYRTPMGHRKTYSKKGFPTKQAALLHEADMRGKLLAPGYAFAASKANRKQTVREYLEGWLENYARPNLRPNTYDSYFRTVKNYICPYIGSVPLNHLAAPMVDQMFQQLIENGLKPSTAEGAKRVLSVALGHARKYGYIESNAVRDTITKFSRSDKTPDPYTPQQMRSLLEYVRDTEWEMPVMLGGLYGLRRCEILGLRWRNVDLKHNLFDVIEQLPAHMPPGATQIEEMAPPKSNGRRLPITPIARPYFEKQLALQAAQQEIARQGGISYYHNDLVVAKPNGAPYSAGWISSNFGRVLLRNQLPVIRFHDLRHTAATNMHQLTGDFYTAGDVLGHTLAGISASLGIPVNYDTVTARYVDVRMERKREVLEKYHAAVYPELAPKYRKKQSAK